jgi:hypothetical protein
MSHMAAILWIPKACMYQAAQKIKEPFTWEWMGNISRNLSTSPFKRDLSIDTAFSQIHSAGQSL